MTDSVLSLTLARRTVRATLSASWLENGTLEIYTAPRPSTGGVITTQTLLLDIGLAGIAVTADVITADVGTGITAMGLAADTAAWGRLKDNAGDIIGDCDVGDVNSVALAKLDSLAIVAGSLTTLVSFNLTEG